MNTPLAVPCTMSRFSCVSQQNFASCLRPVVPKMHLHRLARGPQRRVPTIGAKPCGRHHFCCRSSLLDQAWGTHVNAQVSHHPHKHWCLLTATALGHLQELATNIFSTSIVPYSAFLYWLTKSKKTPPLALFGFYFLLVFVFATIPAGVIGKAPHLVRSLALPHLITCGSELNSDIDVCSLQHSSFITRALPM